MNEIDRLKKRTKDQMEELELDRKRRKTPEELMDNDIPQFLPFYDFWCDVCQEDFSSPARKTSYRLEGNIISTIRGTCPNCETVAIRHARHRDQDPYYYKSLKIRRQRNQYAMDMIQPGQHGFRSVYGEPFEAFERKMREKEEDLTMEELGVGLRGQSIGLQERLRRLRRNF